MLPKTYDAPEANVEPKQAYSYTYTRTTHWEDVVQDKKMLAGDPESR